MFLILGNQLFAPSGLRKAANREVDFVFMREDPELCTYYRFHKHKIIFFLAAMRAYRAELQKDGFSVHYQELEQSPGPYETCLLNFIKAKKIRKVHVFEIEDKFFELRIQSALRAAGVELVTHPSPMFLTTRDQFAQYLASTRKPFMKSFYEQQRQRLKILVDARGNPVGGQWSFDVENRKALPAKVVPPELPQPKTHAMVTEVSELVARRFADHPGQADEFWLPIDRAGARRWLKVFLTERLRDFGPYEDALASHSPFVFHSVLTPFLNCGLLTPQEVVAETIKFSESHKIPLSSLEGFLRQVIGWREFVRGIYRQHSETQDQTNFWGHHRKLADVWYLGDSGVPPLDVTLNKVFRYAYAHHIERLMVVGSLMLLLEVDPREAHRWFMEMFIDSSDWVMGPNVYGMALFSDGGIFATKPYICGSNYYRKMGGFKAGEWCDGVDGLYWSFVERHQKFFSRNPRLSMMAKTVMKMDSAKKKRLYAAADQLRARLTTSV